MTLTTAARTAAASLALAAALTGCASQETGTEQPGTAVESPAPAAHNSADAEFAQMMTIHHEGAVEMADLAVEKAQSEEVRGLAEGITAAQGPEIELMTGWLEAWGEDAPDEAEMGGMGHGGMEMDGLDQEAAMAEIEGLEGADFDRRFLELMTAHHEGAVEMAESLIEDGENTEARALAEKVIEDQTAEIAEMSALVDGL